MTRIFYFALATVIASLSPAYAQDKKAPTVRTTLTGHTKTVRSLSFSSDGKTLASASSDTTVKLWDVATSKERAALINTHTNTLFSVAFSPDGKTLASFNVLQTTLWEVATRKERMILSDAGEPFAFSPDSTTLASAKSGDHTIKLWDVEMPK